MSKRHFIALADALRGSEPVVKQSREWLQWKRDIEAIASVCRAENFRFNYERWIGYINGENGPSGGRKK